MVLVFILQSIIILISLIVTILLFSTIRIEINNLELNSRNKNKNINNLKQIQEQGRKQKQYRVKISLYFLGVIPIFWINLNSNKMKKIYSNKRLEKIDFNKIKNKVHINKNLFIMLKELNIKLRSLNLIVEIGIEDAILTSYIIAIIASIISIILPHITNYKEINKCKYVTKPLYNNKNEYYILLDSIIDVKIVHIIYSMLNFMKRGMKKYERSSNRRSYAYSNE